MLNGSRTAALRRLLPVLAAVSLGGMAGAAARHGTAQLWPGAEGAPPATLTINALGCAAMGVLMALVEARRVTAPWVRPLVGTGVISGFTTFATYSSDAHRLLASGRHLGAGLYLIGTVIAALLALWAGLVVTRRFSVRRATTPRAGGEGAAAGPGRSAAATADGRAPVRPPLTPGSPAADRRPGPDSPSDPWQPGGRDRPEGKRS